MDGPRINHDPHIKADGGAIRHVPLTVVLNPKIKRPPVDVQPDRDEYDAGLRLLMHLCMIFGGIFAVTIMTIIGVDIYLTIAVQGIIPGAIQELEDFKLHV